MSGVDSLAAGVIRDIDEFSYTYDDGFRTHLGASQIGGDCLRSSFYDFRWVSLPSFAGKTDDESYSTGARMHRLWQRGHREEDQFIHYLRSTGWKVYDRDTRSVKEDGTHPQFRIDGYKGHFGGSLDAVGVPPEKYSCGPMLLEFKTAAHKTFLQVKLHGVKKANDKHYSQMCLYGAHYKLSHALYMCVDKDTDELHIEVVELDHSRAGALHALASSIIDMTAPPERAFKKPNFVCKMCNHKAVCFDGAKSHPSCRSCKFNLAVDNKGWFCQKQDRLLEKSEIPHGCGEWSDINDV